MDRPVALPDAPAVRSWAEVSFMTAEPLFFADLLAESPPPARGILSQTLYDGDDVRLVMFGFAPGEELSEHTAARPAIVHVLAGEGEAIVGGERHDIGPGSWFRMPARMAHSIHAVTPLTMALYLLAPT